MNTSQLVTFAGRALKDMVNNKIQHGITLITIALSVLIVSTCILFMINVNRLLNDWESGLKIMVYVDKAADKADIQHLNDVMSEMKAVHRVVHISKDTALQSLMHEMKQQSGVFEHLKGNPLPDAFEIYLKQDAHTESAVRGLAQRIQSLSMVADVEYGRQWVNRIMGIVNLIQSVGITISGLFLIVTFSIIINTFRLALYARREEIEVMRLVGATDAFIKAPFYVESLIQGALGGVSGLVILITIFGIISNRMETEAGMSVIDVQFLTPGISGGIVLCSTFAGWLGCFFSLRRYLKI